MQPDNEITRSIQSTIGRIDRNTFQVLPGLIKQLFRDREWEKLKKEGDKKPFKNFVEYCESRDFNGLHIPVQKLMQLCDSKPEVVAMIERETSISYQRAVRNEKIKELRAEGKTQAEIAGEVGLSQNRVSEIVSENSVITQKTDKPKRTIDGYRITQYTKPETAAAKIREKFGDEFADTLKQLL